MVAALAIALVLLPLAASAPLFDPDEGLHAAIAQEMVRTGDYVTPRFLGEPFLDKPILFFWADALSLRIFGMNEAGVRLPPLLFGLLGMIGVVLLGRALFDESTGLCAGIAYATMVLPLAVSEMAIHDVGLVPFMCIAAWMLTKVWRGGGVWLPALVAGGSLGLSVLTKGLVGIVFVGIYAVCLVAARRDTLVRVAIALSIAVVLAVLVAAPWYIAMEHAHPGYLHYYFIERHLQGYLTATQRHAGRPWWYYLPIVIGGALPWTGYLMQAARRMADNPLRLVVWGWFALGLIFLSLGESKLVTYVLPLFPALAIVAGEQVSRAFTASTGFAVHVFSLAALPIAGLLLLQARFGGVSPWLWPFAALAGVLVVAIGWRARHSTISGRLVDGIVWMSIVAMIGVSVVTPRAAAWMTGRDLARALSASAVLPPRILIVDERFGSVVFYLSPALRDQLTGESIRSVSLADLIQRVRVEPADAIVAIRANHLSRLARLFAAPPVPEAAAGTFRLYRAGALRAALDARP